MLWNPNGQPINPTMLWNPNGQPINPTMLWNPNGQPINPTMLWNPNGQFNNFLLIVCLNYNICIISLALSEALNLKMKHIQLKFPQDTWAWSRQNLSPGFLTKRD